jgi:hypothetical protein
MPTPEQTARLARVLAWLRTAKEALPAINHGPNAVPAEQIARASGFLDRMYRRAVALSASAEARAVEAGEPSPVDRRATAAGRQAA